MKKANLMCKKSGVVIAAVMAGAVLMAGCGSGSSSGNNAGSAAASTAGAAASTSAEATTSGAAAAADSSSDGSSTTASSDAAADAASQTDAGSSAAEGQDNSNVEGNVSTNGSTSMEKVIGNLMEQFMNDHSGVTITYDATGSGTGIEAVSNGTCDIGLASRDLKDEETAKGLAQTTIALDGIAIIVNAQNDVSDLSVDQIASIYKGEITNWSEVGGSDLEIAAIGREAGSGTRDGFETITDTKDQCQLSQELTSTGAVIEAVRNTPNAIGYASFSDAQGQDGITLLTVDGVACSEDTISDGTYKIQRDFNLITKDGTALSPAAQAFFDYATSAQASDLISKAGVVPTNK